MLTETMIQRDREERERLGPIAQMVGLSLEAAASDRDLHAALVCIAERREECGLSRPTSTRSAEPVAARQPSTPSSSSVGQATPAGCTLGMQVAEQMLAERQGRQPAAWAVHPLPSPTTSTRASATADGHDAPTVAAMARILETQRRAAAHRGPDVMPTPSEHPARFRIG